MKFATKIKYYDSLLNYSLKFANGRDLYRLRSQNNFKTKSQTAFKNIKQRILTRFLCFLRYCPPFYKINIVQNVRRVYVKSGTMHDFLKYPEILSLPKVCC